MSLLQYCLGDKPERRPFEPANTALQEYPITQYQPVYFVANSFESAKTKMRYTKQFCYIRLLSYNIHVEQDNFPLKRHPVLRFFKSLYS